MPLEQGQATLRKLLGSGFEVDPPAARGQHFESLMGIYTMTMNIASLFALFIGTFIIYNSFAIAVTQRRAEIGILRALGATRGQIRSLFLGESAVAGLAGSAIGIGFGLLMAQGLTVSANAFMEGVMGVSANAGHMLVRPWLLITAAAVGVFTSMIAAFLPARNAARVDPVKASAEGAIPGALVRREPRRRVAALAAIAIAVACLLFGHSTLVFYSGYFLAMLALLLLTPALSLYLSKVMRTPLKWLHPVEGALAADSLIQSPRRTSATVAALMLSLALVIALGGMARASYMEITDWMDNTMNPDFFVTTSETHFCAHVSFSGQHAGRAAADSRHRPSAAGADRAHQLSAANPSCWWLSTRRVSARRPTRRHDGGRFRRHVSRDGASRKA